VQLVSKEFHRLVHHAIKVDDRPYTVKSECAPGAAFVAETLKIRGAVAAPGEMIERDAPGRFPPSRIRIFDREGDPAQIVIGPLGYDRRHIYIVRPL